MMVCVSLMLDGSDKLENLPATVPDVVVLKGFAPVEAVHQTVCHIGPKWDTTVAVCYSSADAERIALCFNFCRGMMNEELRDKQCLTL